MSFIGSQKLNVNAGGRIAIPTKYRNDLLSDGADGVGGSMVLTSHLFKECLVLYPKAKFDDVVEQIQEIEDTAQAEVFNSVIIGPAVETEMDGQGRIMIPPSLRELSGIEKEVMLVGQVDSFQLWDAQVWNDDFKASRAEAKKLLDSGSIRLKL